MGGWRQIDNERNPAVVAWSLEVEQWSDNRTIFISVDQSLLGVYMINGPLIYVRPGCMLYVVSEKANDDHDHIQTLGDFSIGFNQGRS